MQANSKRILRNTISTIFSLFIAISSVFLVLGITLNCVYIKTYVRGYSMQPTLNISVENTDTDGDIVYINRFRDYDVNDIIVANTGIENARYVIKRLIGLEGDVIQIKQVGEEYNLIVNNEIIYAKPITYINTHGEIGGTHDYYTTYLEYIDRHRGTDRVIINTEGEECIQIGKNECFLMGDNWGESTDSITFYGTLNVSLIVGKVDIVIPYGQSQFKGLIKSLWNILT